MGKAFKCPRKQTGKAHRRAQENAYVVVSIGKTCSKIQKGYGISSLAHPLLLQRILQRARHRSYGSSVIRGNSVMRRLVQPYGNRQMTVSSPVRRGTTG